MHDTAVQILRYSCIVRAFIEQDVCGAPHCLFACPSQVVYVLEVIQKRGESPLHPEISALSTGPLGPDPALQQIDSRPLLIRTPRSADN